MKPAAYQEYASSSIPVMDLGEDCSVKVIAGEISHRGATVKGPVADSTTHPMNLE